MNRKEVFDFLTGDVAVTYRPRRMPWEHDQDTPETQRSVLIRWVDEISAYPKPVVEQAFSALVRHAPNQVPTLNETVAQLRRIGDAGKQSKVSFGAVVPPVTGIIIAYEAYCEELARQGRSPDETRFTAMFNRMFPA